MEVPDLNAATAVELTAGLGALNWGLDATAGIDVVTELLGTGNAELGYLALGGAGAVLLAERFELVDVTGQGA